MMTEKEYVEFLIRAKEITKEVAQFYGINSANDLDITFVHGGTRYSSVQASYSAMHNNIAFYIPENKIIDLNDEIGQELFVFIIFHELRHYTQNQYLRTKYGDDMYEDILAAQMSASTLNSSNIMEEDADKASEYLTENFMKMKGGETYDTEVQNIEEVLTPEAILETIKNYYNAKSEAK